MIDANDLLLYKSSFVTIRHLEKDYLQTFFLNELYATFSSDLVFKGGTALQKLYGLGRFSEDLDFTFNGNGDYKDKLAASLKRASRQYSFNLHEHPSESGSVTIEVRNIRGPLYVTYKTMNMLKLDISLRESMATEPQLKYLTPVYPDIKQFSLYVMSLDEILAEKIRAIYTRSKARDLYDVYFFMKHKNKKLVINLINKKLESENIKFSRGSFLDRINAIGSKLWREELSEVLVDLPDYRETIKFMEQYFNR